jgi:serine/threonine protein kinase
LFEGSLLGMKDVAARFRREARAASLVESQHIVQVFDVGSDGTLGLYLVMEYLAGEDLAQMLARETRLAPQRATRIGLQVARGLAKAHAAGVVHRDLKPANIFLCAQEDDEPLVKILDFGISKVIDSTRRGFAPGLKLTRDGMVVGTPQYMSPEQAQGYPVDERTDVWALGLVLYEMLAGQPAYPELATYEQFIIHLVSRPPEPLRSCAPWVSEELARVVHAAVEHDLAKRIPTCAALAKQLSELQEPSAGSAPDAADAWVEPTTSQLEDFEEDAPQFFDRKLLDALGPTPSGGSEKTHGATTGVSTPSSLSAGLVSARLVPLEAPRVPRAWVWPAIAVVAFAIALVAAFALR